MKCQIYYTALLLLSIILTASSCDTTNMPDEDNNKDWNILEWTVDGEKYKAECEGDPLFGCDPVDCQYYNDTKTLSFIGGDLNKNSIELYIYRHLKLNIPLKLLRFDELRYGNGNNQTDCAIYHADTASNSYRILIEELDTIQKFITGNFSFNGINNCNDTINIKEGYFKLSYRP